MGIDYRGISIISFHMIHIYLVTLSALPPCLAVPSWGNSWTLDTPSVLTIITNILVQIKGTTHSLQRLGTVGFDGGNTERMCLNILPTELGVNSRFLYIMIWEKCTETYWNTENRNAKHMQLWKYFWNALPLNIRLVSCSTPNCYEIRALRTCHST
jgi:hypothetical protein